MSKRIVFLLMLLYTSCSYGQKAEVFVTRNGAIDGYDPVAYFTKSKAVEGKDYYTYRWKGADWYFSSRENLDTFEATPDKYAPRYGGYCAYAVSQGYTAKIDPDAWSIVEGRLYLNYNKSVQKKWEAAQEELIKQADDKWPKVLDKEK